MDFFFSLSGIIRWCIACHKLSFKSV